TRAGSRSWTSCRRPPPEKSSGSSSGSWMVRMNWASGEMHWIEASGRKLEARAWGGSPADKPTIVLLHEGLGSVGMWRNFPEKLAERTGYCVFAYSRAGYGRSDPAELPRPLDYMTREAAEVLPQVLDAIGFK